MIKIAVCDDEEKDLKNTSEIIEKIIAEYGDQCKIKMFLSANSLLKETDNIDIGVLDISMDELDGIELGRRLKVKFPEIKLIYTTSYRDFCVKAVNEAHAFSFLCKPVSYDEMHKQLKEIINGISVKSAEKEFRNVKDSSGKEYEAIWLCTDDIIYIEYIKRQRKVRIVTRDKEYECEYTINELVRELEHQDFEVSARGNAVNLKHVQKIKGFMLYMDNGDEIPVAQKRIVEFKAKLNEFLQRNA